MNLSPECWDGRCSQCWVDDDSCSCACHPEPRRAEDVSSVGLLVAGLVLAAAVLVVILVVIAAR